MKRRSSDTKLNTTRLKEQINWRAVWYSVIVWLLAIVVSGFVILPWYYLVLPFVVFWTTVIYFRNGDKTLARGIWIGLFWFFAAILLDAFEIVGPYYKNISLYYLDLRNFLKYPLILLIPVLYGLVWENINLKKTFKKRFLRTVKRNLILPPGVPAKA